MRIASANVSPCSAAARSTRRNCSSVARSLSRSTSTQRPRMSVEPVGSSQQRRDLGVGQPVAVERHLHPEVEERVGAEAGRAPAADGRAHLGPRRSAGSPRARHAHDDPGGLELAHVAEEPERLFGRPAQRVEDLSRVDHGPEPRAALGGALDRKEERQEPRLVGRARVLAERLSQGDVLGLRVRRQPRGVGRQEGERRVGVLAVLGQVEVDAPDDVPGRVLPLEEVLHRRLRPGQLGAEGRVDRVPERLEHGRRQVFRAGHRRRADANESSSSDERAGMSAFAPRASTSGEVHTAVT